MVICVECMFLSFSGVTAWWITPRGKYKISPCWKKNWQITLIFRLFFLNKNKKLEQRSAVKNETELMKLSVFPTKWFRPAIVCTINNLRSEWGIKTSKSTTWCQFRPSDSKMVFLFCWVFKPKIRIWFENFLI